MTDATHIYRPDGAHVFSCTWCGDAGTITDPVQQVSCTATQARAFAWAVVNLLAPLGYWCAGVVEEITCTST